MTALEIVRFIGTEFVSLPDTSIEQWIEVCRPMVSRKLFGSLYEQALALLVCHNLKINGLGDNSLGKVDDILRVGSYSEGGVSISYNRSIGGKDEDGFNLTIYGIQYKNIRKLCIMPIRSAGEGRLL